MATLLVKFTNESQYNPASATITYADPGTQRWIDVYGKLKTGDNCIFHSDADNLYVGDFASSVTNTSVTFNNIKTVKISLDDLLRISELNPETIAVFKRPPGPILKDPTIDVKAVFNAATAKHFVSFYIIKQGKEAAILPSLKDNDRVVIIDQSNRIIDLFLLINGSLQVKLFGAGLFGAKGKTLADILALMTNAGKSNHVRNIQRVIAALSNNNSYKFPSFNDYYNIMHNKKIYSANPSIGGAGGNEPDDDFENDQDDSSSLNMILYGPPGTGKTFHSISYAVAIVEDKDPEEVIEEANKDRLAVKKRFDDYVNNGLIVFTTFHQSMSYEDFIEGIKPIEPETEEDQLSYSILDGIFKQLCTEAAFSFAELHSSTETEKAFDFSTAYDKLAETVNEKLSTDGKMDIPTKSGGKLIIENVSANGNFRVRHLDGNRTYGVSKRRLSKISNAFPDLEKVNNIHQEFKKVIGGSNSSAYWAVLNAIRSQSNYSTNTSQQSDFEKEFSYDDKKQIIESIRPDNYNRTNPKKFVLIIDEINRGNVSQIFGELITLIEDDKRLGKDEALKATLPYSKERFGIPSNLYIIGTMNTADRSVEALDTALRRRFSFVPKMPEENKLAITTDGIDLSKILQTINTRLRVLKDNDHTIGHAWFWNVNNLTGLKKVYVNKVLPLLQEYFYNDYEKLGLVLGDAFFKTQKQVNSNIFAPFKGGNGLAGQYENSWQFELKSASELIMADFKSLETQINTSPADEDE
jgi:5-methylcytosine-specific restriction endonuclease McrBC GTP-binding regulatory subunit McrB